MPRHPHCAATGPPTPPGSRVRQRSTRTAATCSRQGDPTDRRAPGTPSTPARPSCVKRSHTMWVMTPISRATRSSRPPPHDERSAPGFHRENQVASASRAGRSHSGGSRDSEPAWREFAGRRTQDASPDEEERQRDHERERQPREAVRPRVGQRTQVDEERQVRRHRADRDRGGHERRSDERQRDDRVAQRERHVPAPGIGRSATGQEHAREGLLAATQHRHSAGQAARHDRGVVFAPSHRRAITPPWAIARRASLRLATRPVSTSAWTTGVPREHRGVRKLLAARCRAVRRRATTGRPGRRARRMPRSRRPRHPARARMSSPRERGASARHGGTAHRPRRRS